MNLFLSRKDATSFGQKSIGQMSFSQQVMLMPVGENVRNSNSSV